MEFRGIPPSMGGFFFLLIAATDLPKEGTLSGMETTHSTLYTREFRE